MASFDWYQATVPAPLNDVLAAVLDLEERSYLGTERGMHGYARAHVVRNDDGVVCRVYEGGSHVHPHVQFTSDRAQPGADCIRVNFPEHFVTRLDACEDFGGEGDFDRMLPVLLDVAAARRVRVDTRGDHLLTKSARTVYLGSPSSATRLRLYDKADELRAKFAADPVRLQEIPPNLARLEAQIRPQTREARAAFASIDPLSAMGSSAWLRDVWRGVVGLELDPVQVGKPWRASDDDRAYAFMLAQYGGMLRRRCSDLGSWQCLGLQIGDDLVERDKARKKGK